MNEFAPELILVSYVQKKCSEIHVPRLTATLAGVADLNISKSGSNRQWMQ